MIRFLQSGNKAAKYLLAGLLTIICLSMVVYLIPGLTAGLDVGTAGIVAIVGGEEVKSEDVNRLTNRLMERQGQRFPDAWRPFIASQAVRMLIQQAEINYEGRRLGLDVSDQEVQDELRNGQQYKEYFFPKGEWIGQAKYEDLLTQYGLTPVQFEQQVRGDLLRAKLLTSVTSAVDVSPAEVEAVYRERNTKVKFDYAIIDRSELEKQVNLTDAELQEYYRQNQGVYANSIPEKRSLSYFVIGPAQVQNQAVVTQADIEGYYQTYPDEFRLPDRIKTRHILIHTPSPGPDGKPDAQGVEAARVKAGEILKQVKAGGNFAELARKNSDDPGSAKEGGELPWMQRGRLAPEYEKAAYSMSKGQISDLVQTSYGFHIIQVEDKEVGRLKPLSEVRATIEEKLKAPKLANAIEKLGTAASNDARNLGLEKAAAKYGLQVLSTGPLERRDALPGIGPAPELMSLAFSADDKAGVQLMNTKQAYVLFRVDKIVPPRTPSFEEVRDKVAKAVKDERVKALLARKIQEMVDRARAQHDLRKAAKEAGATVKTSDLVKPTDQVLDIGSMSGPGIRQVFELKPGEIGGPFEVSKGGVAVAVLEVQNPPLGDDFAKAKDGIHEELINTKRQQVQELYLSSLNTRLEAEHKLKTNNTEMEKLTKGRS